nr:hypothetical protein BDOA9_0102270 [Bradyrhizobium sp. DOA9]
MTAPLGERAIASYSVIASAAKQSRVVPPRDSGLLRCARNDEEERDNPEPPLSCPALHRIAGALRRVRDTGARPQIDECGEIASVEQKNPLSTIARRTLMNQPLLVHKRRPAAGGSPPRLRAWE